MKERPILFSAPMVLAILAARKTQTRRIIKDDLWACLTPEDFAPDGDAEPGEYCPHGAPGDHLWVRETWATHADEGQTFVNYRARMRGESGISEPGAVRPEIFYRADGGEPFINNWRPSIFMPRWASRLTLEVESVRVERLQDISEEDAKAEGVEPAPFCKAGRPNGMVHVEAFEHLWDRINVDRASWKSNPWIWVVSFKRVQP